MITPRRRKRDGRTVYDVKLRGPDGRSYVRTFETKKAALDFEAAERVDRARGVWADTRLGRQPFSEAAESWTAASVHKRPLSVERDRAVLANHVLPAIGHRSLDSIRPADIQALVNRWAASSPPATVMRQYATMRAVFNHAVTTDLLGRSPCRGIRLPQVEPRESPLVDAADLERLAAAMPAGLAPVPYLGAVLGLRWAEIAGLRVGSLNFLARTLTVDRQWTRGKGGTMVSQTPKTRAGRRTISVPGWLMEMLTAHLAGRGVTGSDPDAPVFVGTDGRRLDYSNWRQRVWLPATKATGLVGLRFHDLRHAAGTALVAGGVDIKTAQVRLGHASPVTTLRVYAQGTHEADRAAADSVGELFRPGDRDTDEGLSTPAAEPGRPGTQPIARHERDIVSVASSSAEGESTSDQDFSGGARWNRTTDLSIISAAL